MRKAGCGVLLAVFVLAAVTTAWADQYTDQGWNFKKDKDGIKIYNREKLDSDIRELLAITEIDAPSWRLFAVVGKYDDFKEFMPYTVVSKCLKRERISEKKTINYFFTALDLPLVSNRYYTLRLTDEMDADGRPGVARSAWTMSREQGLDPSYDDPQVSGLFPDNFSDPVKTSINDGYWLFEPVGDGSSTRVSYYVYTDPGGKIPSFVANQANSIAVPKLMDAVRKRVKDPRYDRFAPKERGSDESPPDAVQ